MRWNEFFTDHFIEFVTSGPLTTRGHIEIKCPMCGDNDPSFHMGINTSNGHWYCWRDKTHRGTKPDYLISRLLGVSGAQAKLLVQAYAGGQPDDFNAPAAPTAAIQPITPVAWPSEFEPLTDKYLQYLSDRGFDRVDKLAAYYNLECCQIGRWKQRLIVPVLDRNMGVIGWQGRAIVTPKKAPRYMTSHAQVKRSLFNLQNLNKGETLFVCEGPFDALKIDWYGKPKFRATCTFGVNPTIDQISLLRDLSLSFNRLVVLFDSDSSGLSGGFNLNDWLPAIKLAPLPDNKNDPGSMTGNEIRGYLNEFHI